TADYTINSPAAASVYNTSDILPVSWTTTSNSDKTVNVTLAHGEAQNLQPDVVMCMNIAPNVGQCNYTIGNLTSRRDYAVIVGNVNNPGHEGISSYFTINSTGPLPPPSGCPKFVIIALKHYHVVALVVSAEVHLITAELAAIQHIVSIISAPVNNTCGGVTYTADYPCCSPFKFCGDSEDYYGEGCDPASSFNEECVNLINPQISQ
ncbi:27863_t:CDS:2, partial [Dentiscutata erythropus]